jgi:hypothetical protein
MATLGYAAKKLLSAGPLWLARSRRERWQRVVFESVPTIAQPGENLNFSPMLVLCHRLRSNIVGIGVIQDQPRNFTHVQIGERPHVVAAKRVTHQNVRSGDVGPM